MRLFVTARFKSDENRVDIEKLCRIAREAGFDDFCFIRDIEKYQSGVFSSAHELMMRAKEELLRCDALLIDLSDNPGGGRVIEAGIALGMTSQSLLLQDAVQKLAYPCRVSPLWLLSMKIS